MENYTYVFKRDNVLKRVLRTVVVLIAAKQILQWLCPIKKVTIITTKVVEDKSTETKTGE